MASDDNDSSSRAGRRWWTAAMVVPPIAGSLDWLHAILNARFSPFEHPLDWLLLVLVTVGKIATLLLLGFAGTLIPPLVVDLIMPVIPTDPASQIGFLAYTAFAWTSLATLAAVEIVDASRRNSCHLVAPGNVS